CARDYGSSFGFVYW
nr:immunoglobulin heavy chain junction region [Mus musculus]